MLLAPREMDGVADPAARHADVTSDPVVKPNTFFRGEFSI